VFVTSVELIMMNQVHEGNIWHLECKNK